MKKVFSLRVLLFLNTSLILLLGMGLAALLSWRAVEGLYLDTERENLLAQARLTAAALANLGMLPGAPAQPYSQTSNVQPGIHTRLLDEQGGVIISVPILPGETLAPPVENSAPVSAKDLMERPEIAQALKGQSATAIRTVGGRRVLYAAAPVLSRGGG